MESTMINREVSSVKSVRVWTKVKIHRYLSHSRLTASTIKLRSCRTKTPTSLSMFYSIGLVAIILLIVLCRFCVPSDPPKIKDVYSQGGKWFRMKFWIFYFLLQLRKLQNSRQKQTAGKDAGYGKRSRSSLEEMERPQELPMDHPKAVDAVYFNGGNGNGEYFVAATARRHDKLVQTLLYLKFPDIGLLELLSLPDTSLKATEERTYAAGGLKLEVVNPMKKWKLSFDGVMRLIPAGTDKLKELYVEFDLDWVAYTQYFDFDTDLHTYALCDAMARETWNKHFFRELRVAHQTHYEQFGEISGTVHIEGFGSRELKVQGVRDHSYGNIRDWRDLHRYGIQYLHLEDGTAVCLGNICMPRTLSRLIIGYVIHPDGQMDVVSSTDFELHELGEDGNPPNDFSFNFVAGNKKYHLQGHVNAVAIFYMGANWEARIHERLCFYEVNGIKGWGISEWDYRNHTGKPKIYKKKD